MAVDDDSDFAQAAEILAGLYEQSFGGKPRGRFRISMKHLRALTGRRRLYSEDIDALSRSLYELGYALIDMESFCVVLSQRTFASYRRVNETSIDPHAPETGPSPAQRRIRRRRTTIGLAGA